MNTLIKLLLLIVLIPAACYALFLMLGFGAFFIFALTR